MPHETPFLSLAFQDSWYDYGIGEVPGKRIAVKPGNPVGYSGSNYCGDADAWGGLIESPDDPRCVDVSAGGRSACCDPPTWCGRVGLAIGGRSVFRVGFPVLAVGGRARQTSSQQRGASGLAVGGRARMPAPALQRGAGGLEVGGAARFPGRVVQRGQGGLVIGGRALQGRSTLQRGRGGVVIGGAAPQLVIPPMRAVGGLLLGGAARQEVSRQLVATGGLLLGGKARQALTASPAQYVSQSAVASGVPNPYTHPAPSDPRAGDLLLWFLFYTGPSPAQGSASPAFTHESVRAINAQNRFYVMSRVTGASEPLSYTWTATGMNFVNAVMVRIRNWKGFVANDPPLRWEQLSRPRIAPRPVAVGPALLVAVCWNYPPPPCPVPAGHTDRGANSAPSTFNIRISSLANIPAGTLGEVEWIDTPEHWVTGSALIGPAVAIES